MSVTDQTRLGADPGGTLATIETSGRVIRPAFDVLDTLVDEVRLTVGPETISTAVTDPPSVAMVELTVHADAFESYDGPEEPTTIGVRLDPLTDALSGARMGIRTDDPVGLTVGEDAIAVTTAREYDDVELTREGTVLTIDPEIVRETPDIPELDLPATATVPVRGFEDAVGFATRGGHDYGEFTADADGHLTVAGTGSDAGEEAAARFQGVCSGDESDLPVTSIYSQDYLGSLVDGLVDGKVDEVTLRVGDDFPLMCAFSRERDGTTLYEGEYMIAPRIGSGDDL